MVVINKEARGSTFRIKVHYDDYSNSTFYDEWLDLETDAARIRRFGASEKVKAKNESKLE